MRQPTFHSGTRSVEKFVIRARSGVARNSPTGPHSEVQNVAESTTADWDGAPDVPVRVMATTADGTVAVRGIIRLWVTPVRTESSALTRARR